MTSLSLPETFQPENLGVWDPESLHHLQLHRHPVRGVVAQLREVIVDGLGVNLNVSLSDRIHLIELVVWWYLYPLVSPLHDEVSIDFYRELSVVNFQNLEVVKSNLDLCWRLPRGVEGRVELAVVGRNTKHVVYGAVPAV